MSYHVATCISKYSEHALALVCLAYAQERWPPSSSVFWQLHPDCIQLPGGRLLVVVGSLASGSKSSVHVCWCVTCVQVTRPLLWNSWRCLVRCCMATLSAWDVSRLLAPWSVAHAWQYVRVDSMCARAAVVREGSGSFFWGICPQGGVGCIVIMNALICTLRYVDRQHRCWCTTSPHPCSLPACVW